VNERIKELAEQAGFYYTDKTGFITPAGCNPAKFAELIVEECCNRLREETILHDGYGYNQHELYNRLRKHFGVEL
jgi:hypothetical protein